MLDTWFPPLPPMPWEGRRSKKERHHPSYRPQGVIEASLRVQAGRSSVKLACGGSPWTPEG